MADVIYDASASPIVITFAPAPQTFFVADPIVIGPMMLMGNPEHPFDSSVTQNAMNNVTFQAGYLGEVIEIVMGMGGGTLSNTFHADPISISLSIGGTPREGIAIRPDPILIVINPGAGAGSGFPVITTSLKSNWVAWSKIGDTRIILDHSNEAGMMPMPFSGTALRCMSLGANVVIYGTNGIAMLIPVATPVVTYGIKELYTHGIGLLHESAVGGDRNKHFFIGNDGSLYVLRVGDALPTRLYYDEFISAILPSGTKYVAMSYDPLEDRLYISTASGGLIYTPKGMGGGYAQLTSIIRDGSTISYGSSGAITISPLSIETDTIDFDIRGLKTIRWVDILGMIPPGVQASLGYRYTNSGTFSYTDWKNLNTEGSVFFGITALEFRVKLRLETYAAVNVDSIGFKFTVSDKRFLRSGTKYDRRYDV